ncbi:hypothetical protein BU15DRAFT_60884 [Melanogaster broomeanus]|nr:hypothetical protein BU15DRAFT_60884 [Melanogaster broomeanus]
MISGALFQVQVCGDDDLLECRAFRSSTCRQRDPWAVKQLVDDVLYLFSDNRDDPFARPSTERARASDHRTHPPSSRKKSTKRSTPRLIPAFIEPRAFLPFYYYESYEEARADARRLQAINDESLTRMRKAERRGVYYRAYRYDKSIDVEAKGHGPAQCRGSTAVLGYTVSRSGLGTTRRFCVSLNRSFPSRKKPARGWTSEQGLIDLRKFQLTQLTCTTFEWWKPPRRGIHSDGGISRPKPAVTEDLELCGQDVEIDPMSAGVLIVQL